MNAFYFFKTDREIVFNITSCVGIMSQFNMIMKTILISRCSQACMPFQSFLFPVFIPFFLRTGTNKELHFHLLKFSHAENKLSCYNFIRECFTDLRSEERRVGKECRSRG